MWNPLQNLLTAPSSTPSIKTHVLWIIGTAVQNNPSAQASVRHPSPLLINLNQLMHIQYLSLSPLPTLLSFLHPENASAELRSKAAYALSGLLKHNAVAVKALDDADGWSTLRSALEGPSFLSNSLIFHFQYRDLRRFKYNRPTQNGIPTQHSHLIHSALRHPHQRKHHPPQFSRIYAL